MTELFGVVKTLDERSRTLGVGSNFWGICLNRKLSIKLDDVGKGWMANPGFHGHEDDPSSALLPLTTDSGISTTD